MAKVTWEMSGEEAVGSSRTAFIKKIYELAEKDQSIVLVNCDCSPEGSMQDKFGKSFGEEGEEAHGGEREERHPPIERGAETGHTGAPAI